MSIDSPAPMVIAHRATMGHAPENTLRGLRAGLAMGVDGIEIDVQLSADGVAVLMHDTELDRTTDGRGPVASQPWASLQSLDAGDGEHVPSLAEALDIVGRQATLIIEVKTGPGQISDDLVSAVAREVRQRDLTRHAWLWSFDAALLQAMSAIARDIPIAHLCRAPTDEVLARVATLRLDGVSMHGSQVTAENVATLRAKQLQVFAWTVNEPEHLARLAALGSRGEGRATGGLTGIVGDYPERISTAITNIARDDSPAVV
ncbi:MAG TPA: glycerophosphodiester phosphodiesterase [Dehalococcoidia bacterium]|nr:glycerophosphodiester phosphodiesterase [Dehalococcoidia bacterium]